jgi:RNA polymerase sigma-70 factor (ECF subfamily)
MLDAEFVDRLRAGDEGAFLALVARYSAAMHRLASIYLPHAVAEEVVQDAWLGVLRGIHGFRARSSLKTWLFKILMNQTRTRVAREGRSVPFSAMSDPEAESAESSVDPKRFFASDYPQTSDHWATPPKSWGDSPEDCFLSKEAAAKIHQAIEALPPSQREVITLCDIEGCDPAEVSEVLGLTASNQRVLLHRARSKVRQALELYFEDA